MLKYSKQDLIHRILFSGPSDGCTIRVDNAPEFLTLRNDKLLESIGVKLHFGRVKNINKNSSIEKAIQDLESEIKRLVPIGGSISAVTLAIGICHMNNRSRAPGLRAKEIIMKETVQLVNLSTLRIRSCSYQVILLLIMQLFQKEKLFMLKETFPNINREIFIC